MLTRVFSAAVQGVDALEVEVEINTGPGVPQILIVEPIFTSAKNLAKSLFKSFIFSSL